MPHIIADYSANLEERLDMTGFCEHLRLAATEIEALPLPGIRVRALRAEHFAIADGNPDHGYIDISVRLREGRPDDVKNDIAQHLFEAARGFVAPYMAEHPLALSLEVRDIDAALAPKTGTIREHLT